MGQNPYITVADKVECDAEQHDHTLSDATNESVQSTRGITAQIGR